MNDKTDAELLEIWQTSPRYSGGLEAYEELKRRIKEGETDDSVDLSDYSQFADT